MRVTGLILAIAAAGCGDNVEVPACADDEPRRIIVYTGENLWMHPSNPIAATELTGVGYARGWDVSVQGTGSAFTAEQLAVIDAVVFSVTSGPVLTEADRTALEAYFRGGGGFVGVHSASATELEWPFYQQLVGATFRMVTEGVVTAEYTIENQHPIVAGIPAPYTHADTVYYFHQRPEELGMTMLLALDETTLPPEYPQDVLIGYHAMAWAHELYGGRAFYTGIGHTPESYTEPLFMQMLVQGVDWASEARFAARCER